MSVKKPGVELNKEGLCQGCVHHKMKENIDYEKRKSYLYKLAEKYKKEDGYYDCIIPVSGGKDSHYQTYVMKERLGMNPLLVAVSDPFTSTAAGQHNVENMCDTFGCDLVTVDLSPATVRKMVRISFEEFGSPTWPIDRAIYCVPISLAINLDIPFVIYGENTSWEYGGVQYSHDDEEPYSAINQIENDVAKPVDFDLWYSNGIEPEELNQMRYPSQEQIEKVGLEPIYLSYFVPWDGYKNYKIAEKYGFRTLKNEWDREGYIESYDQIDSIGYLINVWMKYPKMGYARATDVVGYRRKSPHFDISIKEGMEIIQEHDYKLDEKILDDFLRFTGYSDLQFWEIVDEHRDNDIFDEKFVGSKAVPTPVNDFENIGFQA